MRIIEKLYKISNVLREMPTLNEYLEKKDFVEATIREEKYHLTARVEIEDGDILIKTELGEFCEVQKWLNLSIIRVDELFQRQGFFKRFLKEKIIENPKLKDYSIMIESPNPILVGILERMKGWISIGSAYLYTRKS